MFIFRANTTQGIGHLKRCLSLAHMLGNYGEQCHFVVDENDNLEKYYAELPFTFSVLEAGLEQLADARQTVEIAKRYQTKRVIVDSYQLGQQWEQLITNFFPVAAIDDLGRDHSADTIIDIRWRGAETELFYTNKVPKNSNCLLGPNFALLDKCYEGLDLKNLQRTHLLFSLGGGGDWNQLSKLIECICKKLPNQKIEIVLGPSATNTASVKKLAKRFTQIYINQCPDNLVNSFKRAKLFIGALGTSLYELAATKTPALTFCLAPNQEHQQAWLDDLGHCLHISELLEHPVTEVSALILTLLRHDNRLLQLRNDARICVDGYGAERVARFLLGKSHLSQSGVTKKKHEHYFKKLTDNLTVREIADSDINAYLFARNSERNNWRMTVTERITRLTHYQWWFNQQRANFVIEEQGQAIIYIWHQAHQHNDYDYLYGGWFSAENDVSFAHAQLALSWQLEYCNHEYPKATWLAVIHKENKFVNLLNQYNGFKPLLPDSEAFAITQSIFKQATPEMFNYVHLVVENVHE